MGRIFDEVIRSHLHHYPDERAAILPFQAEFDITWGARRSAYGSEFSSYIIRPEKTIRDLFGLGMEVALFVFDYPNLEARTFQAINQTLDEEPLRGRVEPASYFLISSDPTAQRWVADYIMRMAQSRSPIPISRDQLRLAGNDKYQLRDLIANFAYRRDLFDYKLPIDDDIYFFGREALVSELIDQIKKGQNTGVFGLRKTGKTSLLYKISRNTHANGVAKCIYIDCKTPIVRKKRATELISYLTRTIAASGNVPAVRYEKLDVFEAFEQAIWLSSKKIPICIIFDEIEYISPYSLTDPHWSSDFIDFWQLLWSTQSQVKNVSYIVSGVNAAVCEVDRFNKIQNPMFGIFNNKYIQGLDRSSLKQMVQHFGGQMGLHFSDASVGVLEKHYGGHPLLTRMACSYVHKLFESAKRGRPIDISNAMIETMLRECDQDIAPYCAHIVSELRDFYPIEYEVIEMSAIGQKHEFAQFGGDLDLSRHLRAYGIVKTSEQGLPEIVLPVLRNYLQSEYARANGGGGTRELVKVERRPAWVEDIISRVVHDLRSLFQSLPEDIRRPFGARGIPDSDLLTNTKPCISEDDFQNFITPFYKILYENTRRGYAEKFGFFNEFKADWPFLFDAVNRIRVYRDFTLHLDVSESTRAAYEKYLEIDLPGGRPDQIVDGWFALQQAILDELLYATQAEAATKGK